MSAWIEPLALAAVLAAAILLGLDLWRGWTRLRGARHLERLGSEAEPRPVSPAVEPPGRTERRLRGAGIRVGPTIYLAGSALLALLVFLGVLRAFPGALAAAALAALLAAWIPWSLIGSWGRSRGRRFEEKLVDAVGFMVSALEAGENPTRALASAAEATEEPAARELRRAVERLDLGMSPRAAFEPLVLGYRSEGTRLFALVLIAKLPAGGDLAPVLESVGRIMRERLAMRLRVRAELAGARLSAAIVAVLPYALIPVLLWRRPDWMRSIVEHPLGLRLAFLALLLQLAGILWLRRTVRTEPS